MVTDDVTICTIYKADNYPSIWKDALYLAGFIGRIRVVEGGDEGCGGMGMRVLLTSGHFIVFFRHWQPGGKCMILPSISQEDAERLFPKGYELIAVPSGKKYIRLTPQPE